MRQLHVVLRHPEVQHLLPAFGTILAILFLGEAFAAFHAVGIATILAGVLLATRPVRW